MDQLGMYISTASLPLGSPRVQTNVLLADGGEISTRRIWRKDKGSLTSLAVAEGVAGPSMDGAKAGGGTDGVTMTNRQRRGRMG